jgi:parallel beta-helix repeat protein
MVMLKHTLALILIVSATSPSAAAGIEVLVSTDDQLKKSIASAKPDDTILIRNGTHRDWRIALHASGTSAAPVTLKAQTPGGVRFAGNVRVEITGQHLVVSGFLFEDAVSSKHRSLVEFRNAQHCRLTDCAFVRCGDPNSTFTRTINVTYGSRNNRVDHCYMTGTLSMGMGVVVRGSESGRGNTDNKFDHNHFKDIRRLNSNGQEPIQLGQDQTAFGSVSLRAVVEYNLFDNASGDSEIISNKSADNTIRYNTLRDSKAGICLRGGQNTLVEGNYCLRTRGIRIYGEGHTIVNNYLEETDCGICLPAGQYRPGEFTSRDVSGSYQVATDVLVAHNSIVNPQGPGIELGDLRGQKHAGVVRSLSPERIRLANNLITGKTSVLISNEGGRDVKWQSNLVWPRGNAKSGLSHPGIIQTDLKLLPHGDRYVPSPRSPARSSGNALPDVATDYSGRERTDPPDIGSDELSDNGNVREALRPSDVGPTWLRAQKDGN